MLVNRERLALFLPCPKVASSSISSILTTHCGFQGVKLGTYPDFINNFDNTKLKIQNITSNPIQRIIKHKFQKMFLEDKMYTALPNLNSWLHTTFNRLNHMAEKTNG